jgi:hypothetical protein
MFDRLIDKLRGWPFVLIVTIIFLWLAFQPCPGCEGGVPGNY